MQFLQHWHALPTHLLALLDLNLATDFADIVVRHIHQALLCRLVLGHQRFELWEGAKAGAGGRGEGGDQAEACAEGNRASRTEE